MENKITKISKANKIKFICISAIILIALLGAFLIIPSLIAPEKDDHSDTEWTVNNDCTERVLVCRVCQKVMDSEAIEGSQGLVIENGVVLDIGTCTDLHVVIPAVYEGQPVTSIHSRAFLPVWMELASSSDLSVWDDYVENYAERILSVSIPASVTTINKNAFSYCDSLENIYVAKENLFYTSSDGVLYSKDMTTLIQYPRSKPDESFSIPEGVTSIQSAAFLNSNEIKHLTIPSTLEKMTEWALYTCDSIESVAVSEANEFYCSIDGILYSKDKKTLCSYPAAKEGDAFTVPDGVETIDRYAFYCAKNLVSINLPDTVKEIKRSAFMYCTNLQSIDLGNSVSIIDSNAFSSCTLLKSITIPKSITHLNAYAFTMSESFTDIYFEGTLSQWKTVAKSDSYIHHYGPIKVHCSDGTTEYYY